MSYRFSLRDHSLLPDGIILVSKINCLRPIEDFIPDLSTQIEAVDSWFQTSVASNLKNIRSQIQPDRIAYLQCLIQQSEQTQDEFRRVRESHGCAKNLENFRYHSLEDLEEDLQKQIDQEEKLRKELKQIFMLDLSQQEIYAQQSCDTQEQLEELQKLSESQFKTKDSLKKWNLIRQTIDELKAEKVELKKIQKMILLMKKI